MRWTVHLTPLALNHNRNLQRPIRPTDDDDDDHRVSLSDFSDHESSDEETQWRAGQSSGIHTRKPYVDVSDDDDEYARRHIVHEDEDPFADPFAD